MRQWASLPAGVGHLRAYAPILQIVLKLTYHRQEVPHLPCVEPMQKHSKWFYMRNAGLVACPLAAPIFDRRLHDEFPASDPPTLMFVLLVIGLSAFAVVFVRIGQFLNPLSNRLVWRRPSWEEPPWNIYNPLAAIDLGLCASWYRAWQWRYTPRSIRSTTRGCCFC